MDLDEAKKRLAFFSNYGRDGRERQTVENWLKVKFPSKNFSIVKGANPPDFLINETIPVEVTEVMKEGRKRGDEYKGDLTRAQQGFSPQSREDDLSGIGENGIEWIKDAIDKKKKKYMGIDTSSWTLVIYANFWIFDTFDWEKLRHDLSASRPPFAQIDVVNSSENKVWNVYDSESAAPGSQGKL
ncbi:MAG: DUF1780 domain-containing protein [Nitrospinae bacterium]|nr:DUF1780 domain-containing protein [Nitrospinota bacterium]